MDQTYGDLVKTIEEDARAKAKAEAEAMAADVKKEFAQDIRKMFEAEVKD